MKVPCEVYSRVSGYLRPVSQWNRGKQSEFEERKMLKFSVSYLNNDCDTSTNTNQ